MIVGVLSGKGGVGKSLISAALAYGLGWDGLDGDVEGNNLHIYLEGKEMWEKELLESEKAIFKGKDALEKETCAFGAIREDGSVNEWLCEGCGLCAFLSNSYELKKCKTAKLIEYETKLAKHILSIQLYPGEKASGKMVDMLLDYAKEKEIQDIVMDLAPGLGCATISGVKYCDLCLVVAEPTYISVNYAKRIGKMLKKMGKRFFFVVNKSGWGIGENAKEILKTEGDVFCIPYYENMKDVLNETNENKRIEMKEAMFDDIFSKIKDGLRF